MASHLASKYNVVVWNRDETKVTSFLSLHSNAESRNSPVEAILATKITFIMLWDANSIEQQIFEKIQNLTDYSGRTFVNFCTIAPDENAKFSRIVTENGGSWIESPVLGNHKVAELGKLTVMVAGNKEECERLFPMFSVLGTPRYLGAHGTASATKLALNAFVVTYSAVFSSSYAYLEAAGADTDIFSSILLNGPFNIVGGYYDRWTKLVKSKNFENDIAFTVSGASKDCTLAISELNRCNVDASVFEGANVLIQKSISHGNADKDMAAIYLETKK